MFGGFGVAHLMAQPALRKVHYGPLAQTRLMDLMLGQFRLDHVTFKILETLKLKIW